MPRAIQYRCTYGGWIVTEDDDATVLDALLSDLGLIDDEDTEVEVLGVIELKEEG